MKKHADHYQQQQVLMASPGELLVLAYDGAIGHLRKAVAAMQQSDLDAQHECIGKAQQIVLYLLDTLNHERNPDLASSLSGIYSYVLDRLIHANVNDDPSALDQVAGLLQELRAGWAEADAKYRNLPSADAGAPA